jgi:L-lactate dehydrogenase complex protein LldE
MSADAAAAGPGPTVGLFATCLVDLFRPSVGFAAVKLLEAAGCRVAVPAAQTCCGQPAYNSGDKPDAAALARRTIEAFLPFDYTVVPSGSCGGMIKAHYPGLFAAGDPWRAKAEALAAKTHELVSFLSDVRGLARMPGRYDGIAAYHDSCSGLRELGIKAQPRALLAAVPGLAVRDLPGAEVCCGFGGTFCVKYPDISGHMAGEKAKDVAATGADTLLAGDLGCLLNITGRLMRDGHADIRAYHVAEVLAGVEAPPIGHAPGRSGGE